MLGNYKEVVRQLESALRDAEKLERAAWKRGDVEAYHSYQVQVNNLKFKLQQVKRGAYTLAQDGKP